MSIFIPGLLLNTLHNHTCGKFTGLLPFELFTHVKEGRLHPLDKNGEPIALPGIEYKLKHQRELEETINKVLPLEYGKIEVLYRGEAKEAEKKKFDERKESLQKEYKDLKHKLDATKNKYSWADYELPQEPMKKQKVFDLLQASYFHNRELMDIGINEETNKIPGDTSLIEIPVEITEPTPTKATQNEAAAPQKQQGQDKEEATEIVDPVMPPAPMKTSAVNFFTMRGAFWEVGYKGKTGSINALNGIRYIITLLKASGKSISCKELYQTAPGNVPNITISEDTAIAQGLHLGSRRQFIGTAKERKICSDEYEKLKNQLSTASMETQEEIREQMAKLEPYLNLKERTFADPDEKKAQANINKRLKTVYEAINNAGMKEMAKHLQDNIKTDDAYGLRYTGNIDWEITIK